MIIPYQWQDTLISLVEERSKWSSVKSTYTHVVFGWLGWSAWVQLSRWGTGKYVVIVRDEWHGKTERCTTHRFQEIPEFLEALRESIDMWNCLHASRF